MFLLPRDPNELPTGPVWEEWVRDPHWLVWEALWVPPAGPAQQGKWTKPPVDPSGRKTDRASAAKMTFGEALECASDLNRGGRRFGIGSWPTPDGPVRFGDINHVDDCPLRFGVLQHILRGDMTYVERSPSGSGVRVVFAVDPFERDDDTPLRGRGIEYSGSGGNFYSFTGALLSKRRTIEVATRGYDVMMGLIEADRTQKPPKQRKPTKALDHAWFERLHLDDRLACAREAAIAIFKARGPQAGRNPGDLDPYDGWIEVGMALHWCFAYEASERGLAIWQEASKPGANYGCEADCYMTSDERCAALQKSGTCRYYSCCRRWKTDPVAD